MKALKPPLRLRDNDHTGCIQRLDKGTVPRPLHGHALFNFSGFFVQIHQLISIEAADIILYQDSVA